MPYKERTVIQYSSVAQSCPTICNPITCSMPGLPVITNSQNPPKPMSIVSVIPSNHLILCCPLSSQLRSFPASGSFQMSHLFASRGQSIGVFNFNINSSNEYSILISFRIDWLDFLAVQGSLKSILQYHNSKASILWHSTLFMVQLLHLYMATGKKHSFD